MVSHCRGEDDKRTALFNTVIRNMKTVASMELYKACFVEIRERGYTIMMDFDDLSNHDLFRDINLAFDVAKDE